MPKNQTLKYANFAARELGVILSGISSSSGFACCSSQFLNLLKIVRNCSGHCPKSDPPENWDRKPIARTIHIIQLASKEGILMSRLAHAMDANMSMGTQVP